MGKVFFWSLINAIYSGGLYEKGREQIKNSYNPINDFNEHILTNISKLMLEHVSQVQFANITMKAGITALILSAIAIAISAFVRLRS